MDAVARVLSWLNLVANALGRVFLGFIAVMPGWLSATVAAVVTGLLCLVAFKYTSNQRRIKRVRDDINAHLLALKLFKDNMAVTFRAQGRLLVGAGRLFVLALVPMLVMALPVTLLLGQLGLWYEARPLRVGEESVITLGLAGDAGSPRDREGQARGGSGGPSRGCPGWRRGYNGPGSTRHVRPSLAGTDHHREFGSLGAASEKAVAPPLHRLLALGVLAAACGCSRQGEKLVPVAGKVTVNGKPLAAGAVSFRPDAERGNTSLHHPTGVIADGRFELFTLRQRGAPPGWYKVLVLADENQKGGAIHPAMPRWATHPARPFLPASWLSWPRSILADSASPT